MGVEIWEYCWLLGYVLRSLGDLFGGIRRFTPCGAGGNHGRLGHLDWEGSGYGFTSRVRETSSRGMQDVLLCLVTHCILEMRCLEGFLPLGCCKRRFGNGVPCWGLPTHGAVGRIVVGGFGLSLFVADSRGVGAGGFWAEGAGGCWKRVRPTRKTPSYGFLKGFECSEAVRRGWQTFS